MVVLAQLVRALAARVSGFFDLVAAQEEQVARLLGEMEYSLAEVRRLAALAIAEARRLGQELRRNRTAAAGRKPGHAQLVRELEARFAAATEAGQRIKALLQTFATRLAEARRRHRSLRARRQAVRAWNALHQRGERLLPLIQRGRVQCARLEDQIRALEEALTARAEANELSRVACAMEF